MRLGTGMGKTAVMAALAAGEAGRGGRTLVLVNSVEVRKGDASAFASPAWYGLSCARDFDDGEADVVTMSPVVAASHIGAIAKGGFTRLLVDECHHATPKSSYAKVARALGVLACGVTATNRRLDGESLAETFDGGLCYSRSLEEAVDAGTMPRLKALDGHLDLNLDGVKLSEDGRTSSAAARALQRVVVSNIGRLADLAMEAGAGSARKSACFLPNLDACNKMAGALKARGIKEVFVVDSTMSEQEKSRALEGFRNSGHGVICNCRCLTEGWDEPDVDCALMFTPTRSKSLYQQEAGRASRPDDDKDDFLVVDPGWASAIPDLAGPECLVDDDPATCAVAARKRPVGEYDLLSHLHKCRAQARGAVQPDHFLAMAGATEALRQF